MNAFWHSNLLILFPILQTDNTKKGVICLLLPNLQ